MAEQESARRQVEETAREAKEHAVDGAEAVQRRAETEAERWTSHVGRRGERVADAIGTAGERLRGQEDWLAEGAEAVSRHLARFSETARSKDPGELKADVERFARERPAVFLGAAVAAGLALGRVLRSSAPRSQPPARGEGAGTSPSVGHGGGTSRSTSAEEHTQTHQVAPDGQPSEDRRS